MKYYGDYPKEPIGGGNPYYCCAYCKVSDPAINGSLENHLEWCEYRLKKEMEIRYVSLANLAEMMAISLSQKNDDKDKDLLSLYYEFCEST